MKKNAQFPTEEEPSALDSVHSTEPTAQLKLTPRQARVMRALMNTVGWIPRESVDRIAGASNGPAIISELRRILGHDAIETQRVEATDRDGRVCRHGRYRLTPVGAMRAAVMVPTGDRS